MIIITDTREQIPFPFTKWPDVEIHQAALDAGDYSLAGFEDRAAIERKSLDDLVSCLMGDNRDRFERELARARRHELFTVICEGSWEDISRGRYRSQMQPQAVLQSILALTVRYGVPFVMAGSRDAAEYITHGLLSKYLYLRR